MLRPVRPCLLPVTHLDLGKNVVASLEIGQPPLIQFLRLKLVVDGIEIPEMAFDTFLGVVGAGVRAEDEWPVAGLRE